MMLSDKTVAELRQDFGFTEEMNMFVPDMPNVPDQYLPVIVAEVRPVAVASGSKDMTIGVCQPVPNVLGMEISGEHAINPIPNAINYLWSFDEYFKQMPEEQRRVALSALERVGKATILQQPKYGMLTDTAMPDYPVSSPNRFFYNPKPGYMGKDQVVFLVEMNQYRIKILINLYPVAGSTGPEITEEVCGKRGEYYRISSANEQMSSLLNGINYASLLSVNNSATVNFADLPGAAVGQTIGSNITLDTNAAGNNWFIDTTPWDNSEFLPTSNPNEWVAKAGSAAEGKIDMLSVLLHEYGHALGISHSADQNDFMGTTLTAGVRRLPSAEEMALMQQLISQAKATLTPTPLPLAGEGGNAPVFPTLPLGTSFVGFLGLLRGSRYGGVGIAPDSRTLLTQYDWVANPTLTNGSLVSAAGWSTQGDVTFNPSTASGRAGAILNEVSTSQTRLSQAFLINANDRFLSFTLSGTALDDLTGAPDDAFQVALLNANTGVSLLSGTGLTHTDAFLNLQADGTLALANGVTYAVNADGSRTYHVDLSGIPAGTAVNLSFDLIGFGQNNSHVTVSDVNLSADLASLPQLHKGKRGQIYLSSTAG